MPENTEAAFGPSGKKRRKARQIRLGRNHTRTALLVADFQHSYRNLKNPTSEVLLSERQDGTHT
jgi:transcriptional regulator of met regulon